MPVFNGKLLTCTVVAAMLVSAAAVTPGHAQAPSAEEIAGALKPQKTRTWGSKAKAEEKQLQAFVAGLRKKIATRQFSREERRGLSRIVESGKLSAVDLTVPFAHDSAEISPEAAGVLAQLGTALKTPRLAGSTFLVAGHTDAKGADGYNQALSEKRAQAVRSYLTEKHGVPEPALLAVGFGEEQPKKGSDPYAPENRRVQIVNFNVK